ncbi:hypothetical protein K435DRAFT_959749 [Dendrothele bispora CBS 962.96]|uniref:UBA domain-containing protein n=1 Tax=Dendrothele bispora (strain CBS 962.96) TaxID=1314807 RepID=A0A4S8MWG8_DENBC|nr:hypothetical protein K435DRAFT_959749 [Dendrothele bispora CBS 962.96]
MSDSFADLWSSTAPSKPTAPQKLGSIQSQQPQSATNRRPQNDLFAQLSSTSGPPSRTMTPSYTASTSPKPPTLNSSGDAFASLFSSDSGLSGKSSQNMTIAERAAEADRKRREQFLKSQNQQVQSSGSKANDAWAGLDSLGGGFGGKTSIQATSSLDDDWGLGSSTTVSTNPAKSVSANPANGDDSGLEGFSSSKPTPPQLKAQASSGGSFWDMDEFTSSPIPPQRRSPPGRKPDTPSNDFDFGSREDQDDLLGDFGSLPRETKATATATPSEDDILGALSRPVDELQKERERIRREKEREREREAALSTRSSPPRSHTDSTQNSGKKRSASPPPHIIGRLIEMGFGIDQSRAALAATSNTENEDEAWVQSALEVLISNGAGGSSSEPRRENGTDGPGKVRDDGWGSDGEESNVKVSRQSSSRGEEQGISKPHPRREPGRTTSSRDQGRNRTQSPDQDQSVNNLQEQADKIFAQASELGKGLFSRAGAAWKEGRDRLQRAYEEQYGVEGSRKPTPSGRPAWMTDGGEFKGEDEGGRREKMERFKDDDAVRETEERVEKRHRKVDQEQEKTKENPKDRRQESDVDLFSSSSTPNASAAASSLVSAASTFTGAYVSKWRHGRPKDVVNGSTSTSGSGAPSPSRSPAPNVASRPTLSRPRTPPPHPITLVTASASSLSLSSQHKARATSAFKLGDYPAAESAYTQAIEALPEGHGLSVLLYNNRALTRLKVGNLSGVMDDTGAVCRLVGDSATSRGKNTVKGAQDKAEEINLGDALVKAWKRRAEALEGKEKWEEAGKDWQAVAGAEWASATLRGEGVRGAGRCRRMVSQGKNASENSAAPAKPKPRPKPTPLSRSTNQNSQAVSSLRAANAAAESEDAEKHALKDTVDAKLQAWKRGKETNIRALLASLDTILWPELGVQKLNMSELLTESQVKIKYMKSIAKVHPDKLNSGNSTVEQRMIAGGVFGALNEAWNAFKP